MLPRRSGVGPGDGPGRSSERHDLHSPGPGRLLHVDPQGGPGPGGGRLRGHRRVLRAAPRFLGSRPGSRREPGAGLLPRQRSARHVRRHRQLPDRLDPVCVADDDCDDRDECTSDTCAGGRCTRARLPGFDGVRCELRRSLTALPGVCGTPLPPPKLQQRLDVRLARTERVLAEGRGPARAARRRQRRALRLLRGAEGLVSRSEKADKLDEACALPLTGLIVRLEILLGEFDVGKYTGPPAAPPHPRAGTRTPSARSLGRMANLAAWVPRSYSAR